jgi:hypothetical protein
MLIHFEFSLDLFNTGKFHATTTAVRALTRCFPHSSKIEHPAFNDVSG